MRFFNVVLVAVLTPLWSLQALAFQADSQDQPVEIAAVPEFSPKGFYLGPLPVASISRHADLPNRMHLDPWITPPGQEIRVDPRLLPLFIRVLGEATDAEIQSIAAWSLARLVDKKLADVSMAESAMMKHLKDSPHKSVRHACAYLASRADFKGAASLLVEMTKTGNDDVRLFIEPALARWKVAEAVPMWKERLQDPEVSDVAYQLATSGLVALDNKESVDAWTATVLDEFREFGLRMSAATAIVQLNPEHAVKTAQNLVSGDVPARLLAIALLDSDREDAWKLAASHCTDPSSAVAAAAWHLVFRHKPELLQEHLAVGRSHSDAPIRIVAARTMRLFPTPERSTWLNEQLADIHIEVRNVARQMLLAVSREHAELRDQIVAEASAAFHKDARNWQATEQSVVLIGQLKATQFSAACVPLLDHPREEVAVSAAWLIHLYPDESLYAEIQKQIEANEAMMVSVGERFVAAQLKQQFLFQYAGLVRMKEIEPILDKKFSKMVPDGPITRSAAMWTLGLLYEKNPDPTIVQKFVGRIQDRTSIPPEYLPVRRMSVMALGLVRDTSAGEVLEECLRIDDPVALIPGTARWVAPLLGVPTLPPVPDLIEYVGGWRLTPAN